MKNEDQKKVPVTKTENIVPDEAAVEKVDSSEVPVNADLEDVQNVQTKGGDEKLRTKGGDRKSVNPEIGNPGKIATHFEPQMPSKEIPMQIKIGRRGEERIPHDEANYKGGVIG